MFAAALEAATNANRSGIIELLLSRIYNSLQLPDSLINQTMDDHRGWPGGGASTSGNKPNRQAHPSKIISKTLPS